MFPARFSLISHQLISVSLGKRSAADRRLSQWGERPKADGGHPKDYIEIIP